MSKLGYNRNAKRCKEKWENINKYFKKVKESNKKRPEDSKTCPYFHQLDALYRERAKTDASSNPGFLMKPENQMMPIMARPEQQWPLPQGQHLHKDSAQDDHDSDNVDENDDHDDNDDEEDEDEGGNYEIVTNKQQSSTTNTIE
ncbi:Duplicated homeodomain-like superfamily protein [Abeliophyllum distichum]|uniref:Duplicated homeodomain-like superfamily protein n=1 Tax=Abeliophyllum distichum TaxID=126358 RepID=A0ABD1SV76_9LAMI